jgi:hypothetical protein
MSRAPKNQCIANKNPAIPTVVTQDAGIRRANARGLFVSGAEQSHTELTILCGSNLYWHLDLCPMALPHQLFRGTFPL